MKTTDGLDFRGRVRRGASLVLFTSKNCHGSGKMRAKTAEAMAYLSPSYCLVEVDVDKSPELARKYHVTTTPALMVFNDGQAGQVVTGVMDLGQILHMAGGIPQSTVGKRSQRFKFFQ